MTGPYFDPYTMSYHIDAPVGSRPYTEDDRIKEEKVKRKKDTLKGKESINE